MKFAQEEQASFKNYLKMTTCFFKVEGICQRVSMYDLNTEICVVRNSDETDQ